MPVRRLLSRRVGDADEVPPRLVLLHGHLAPGALQAGHVRQRHRFATQRRLRGLRRGLVLRLVRPRRPRGALRPGLLLFDQVLHECAACPGVDAGPAVGDLGHRRPLPRRRLLPARVQGAVPLPQRHVQQLHGRHLVLGLQALRRRVLLRRLVQPAADGAVLRWVLLPGRRFVAGAVHRAAGVLFDCRRDCGDAVQAGDLHAVSGAGGVL
mmetsp:Transcript_7794/g.27074  ORF Transcript_7794/g.27074 Transcript_7794/m.27074 type:complete len:210 (+) Transcript_7794:2572-3201(+)